MCEDISLSREKLQSGSSKSNTLNDSRSIHTLGMGLGFWDEPLPSTWLDERGMQCNELPIADPLMIRMMDSHVS